jgi:hypothetical protein
METWKTSVNELLRVFRMALIALLPAMEAARIPWKDGEAYDDWDEISDALYRNVVTRSLQWALGGEAPLDDLLPRYNMKLESYRNRGVVLVSGAQLSRAAVFVGLSSVDSPFDTVDCVHVDNVGNVISEVRLPLREVVFSFAKRLGSQQDQDTVTEFSVAL